MIKRIINFILKDLANAMRDNIVVFMILFPLVTAGVIALILPSMESGSVTLIVNKNTVEQSIMDKLDEFGELELFDNDKQVMERVEKFDDVLGITKEGDKYKVILEGNETGEAKELSKIIMDYVLAEKRPVEFKYESLGNTKSFLKEYLMCFLLLSCILIASVSAAFNIVDEKETKSVNALSVSPLSMFEYIFSRGIVIVVMALVLSIFSTIILLGFSINYAPLILGITIASPLGIMMAFLVGGIANNQITAIAILKFQLFIYTGLPVASIFVPENWQWVFYIFPNYWMFNMLKHIFIGEQTIGFWLSAMLTLGSSIIYMFIMLPFIGKQIKLR